MTEIDFPDLIGRPFPYQDEAACRALIDAARGLAASAAFTVLDEIVSAPRRARLSREARRRLVAHWRAAIDHPLADIVTSCALSVIDECPVELSLVMSIMRRVAQFPGQYAALAIVEAAANDPTLPLVAFDAIDRLDLDIRAGWRARQKVTG